MPAGAFIWKSVELNEEALEGGGKEAEGAGEEVDAILLPSTAKPLGESMEPGWCGIGTYTPQEQPEEGKEEGSGDGQPVAAEGFSTPKKQAHSEQRPSASSGWLASLDLYPSMHMGHQISLASGPQHQSPVQASRDTTRTPGSGVKDRVQEEPAHVVFMYPPSPPISRVDWSWLQLVFTRLKREHAWPVGDQTPTPW